MEVPMIRILSILVIALAYLPAAGAADYVNKLSNGTFELDVAGWAPVLDTIIMWDPMDADGNPSSGSAMVTNPADYQTTRGAQQCSEVLEGDTEYLLRAMVLIPGMQPAGGRGYLRVYVYPQPNCGGNPELNLFSSEVYSATPDQWLRSTLALTTQPSAQSALVRLTVTTDTGGGYLDVAFDNVGLLYAEVFEDGFESGDLAQWVFVE